MYRQSLAAAFRIMFPLSAYHETEITCLSARTKKLSPDLAENSFLVQIFASHNLASGPHALVGAFQNFLIAHTRADRLLVLCIYYASGYPFMHLK